MKTHPFTHLPWLALLVLANSAQASSFTAEVDFLAAYPATVLADFDTLPAHTPVSGTSIAGIGFQATVTDPFGDTHQLMTVDAATSPTRSGSGNSLGTDDAPNFYALQAGSPLSFTFANPVTAFGLTVISPEALLDGDVLLSLGAATAELSIAAGELLGNYDGSDWYAYFLGVSTATPVGSASLGYGPATAGVPFLYNLDDLRYQTAQSATVPEPAPWLLWLSGLIAYGQRRAWRLGLRRDSPLARS